MHIIDYFKFTWNDVIYDIELRGRVCQLLGASGTGKSFFVTALRELSRASSLIPSHLKTRLEKTITCTIMDMTSDRLYNEIIRTRGHLFVIDNADLLISLDLEQLIRSNRDNQFAIIGRQDFEFHITPNYYGEIKKSGKRIYTEYEYNMPNWNQEHSL